MFVYSFSIGVFVITLVFFIVYRRKLSLAFKILAAGILISDILVLLIILPELEIPETNRLIAFFSALQMGSLDADYASYIEASGKKSFWGLKIFYSFLCVLTPLVIGGTILSFFENTVDKISYLLRKNWCNKYYFNSLNSQSYELGLSISKADKKALIIYNSNDDNSLVKEARYLGFIIINKPLFELKINNSKKLFYFTISDNRSENLSDTKMILEKYIGGKWKSYQNIQIYMFSDYEEDSYFLNSLEKKDLLVTLVNRYKILAQNLLYKYPLLNYANENGEINIVIIGSRKLGTELFRLMVSLSQLGKKYKANAIIIDYEAEKMKSIINRNYPELSKSFNYEFIECKNILGLELELIIKEKCSFANYICVTLEDEEMNLNTALYLRQWYLQNSKNNIYEPFIAVHISDFVQNKLVKDFKTQGFNYNITSFGEGQEIYNYDSLIKNPINCMAINVHTVYEYLFSDCKEIPNLQKVLTGFNSDEINKYSSLENALSIKYKLCLLGYDLKLKENANLDEILGLKKLVLELSEKLKNKEILSSLTKLEHDRWNAFQRSEGWKQSSVEQTRNYKKIVGKHKYNRAKLHPCICSWEELDVVEEFDKNFKLYDEQLIQKIPEILGLVDSELNLGRCEYIITRR